MTQVSRKEEEQKFHNVLREKSLKKDQKTHQYLTANRKFYAITRKSEDYVVSELMGLKDKKAKILDYCCGNGEMSLMLAHKGLQVIGIDISDVSIENCKERAKKEGVSERTTFKVMDAEHMEEFKDSTFDAILCYGVLHHLDLTKAYPELARVLKPNGKIICDEPLNYNPIIKWYRTLTPHLRTAWEAEHILDKRSLDLAEKSFHTVHIRFFHLSTLLAVPFRTMFFFKPLLRFLEWIDALLLRLPLVKWLAWQMVFILSNPKKS